MNRLLINAIFPGEPIAWQRVQLRGPYMIKPKEMRAAKEASPATEVHRAVAEAEQSRTVRSAARFLRPWLAA